MGVLVGERPNGHIFIIRTHTHARDEKYRQQFQREIEKVNPVQSFC